ncbi:MAG: motility protein A [Oligoflexus sp.]|jgi:chemotaxis protein MotA
MDLTSLLGPLVAVGMLVAGILLKHAGALIPTILWNPPSVAIVIGGTIGALMVAYPLPDFINAFKSLSKFLKNPEANREEILTQIIELAQIARKESILALEKRRDSITFPPLRKAVKLAVDGTDPAVLADTLETEAHFEMEEAEVSVKFWEDFGAIAPTIGILGAVIGLMKVMKSLDKPEEIGPGIMVAFVATLYGVGLANILGIPVGKKLKRKAILNHYAFEMVIIGIDGILSGLNPKIIEEKLRVFTGSHGEEG